MKQINELSYAAIGFQGFYHLSWCMQIRIFDLPASGEPLGQWELPVAVLPQLAMRPLKQKECQRFNVAFQTEIPAHEHSLTDPLI